MKVLLGANDRQQLCELQSWSDLLISQCLSDLQHWIVSKEKTWGQAHVFIETVMPRGNQPSGHNNQFDLLICFDARVAICEMKRHPIAAQVRLKDAIFQINGQLRWLQNLLKSEGYDDTGICPMLFYPCLEESQLQIVRRRLRDLHSAWHIWAVGAHPDMRGKFDEESRPYYLCEALEQRLVGCVSRLAPRQAPLSIFIQKKLLQVEANLLEFDAFAGARAYLRSVAPARQRFIWDTWHVHGLYSDAVGHVAKMLQSHGIVEIVGPPGSGKSTLVKELIERLDEDWVELSVNRTSTRSEIARLAQNALRGEPPTGMPEGVLLQSLAEEPTLFWIREYDRVSAPGLLEFCDALRAISGAKARWLIESTHGLSAVSHHRWELRPLHSSAISRIVEKVRPGGYFTDPEQVVESAQGNPRRAIRLWRSHNAGDTESPDEVEWFLRQLSADEKQMLPVVCHAVSNSPLGVTLGLLRRWAGVSFPDRSAIHCEGVLRSLLDKLQAQQLARVSHLNRQTFDGRLDAVLPENLQLTVVDYLASGVFASVNLNAVEKRLGPNQDKLHEALLDSGEVDSLGFVASALMQADIEPFFRSSFRFTALPFVPNWFDRTDRIPADAAQIYALRALRVLMQVGHRADLSAELDLGLPTADDPLQQHVFAVTRARVAAYHPVLDSFNFERDVAAASKETDADLRCERLSSLALSLQHSNRARESWQIISHLPTLCPPNSPSRILAHQDIFQFLNRKRQRETVVSDAEALQLITVSARETIAYSANVENLQGICDALFYYVRSQELLQGPLSDSAVEGYAAALEFVEQNRRRRVRRLQILLTHGSLHRHACRRNDIAWEDFRRHMDTAFIWYGRAFKSASDQNHLQHKLGALCYMSDFCLKAMRFAASGDMAVRVTIDHALEVLKLWRASQGPTGLLGSLQQPSANDSMVSIQKQVLLRTLDEEIPLLLYIEALTIQNRSSAQNETLLKSWRDFAQDVRNRFPRTSSYERAQYANTIWKRIQRIIRFGSAYNSSTNQSVITVIHSSLSAVLEATKPHSGPHVRTWEQVCTLVEEQRHAAAPWNAVRHRLEL